MKVSISLRWAGVLAMCVVFALAVLLLVQSTWNDTKLKSNSGESVGVSFIATPPVTRQVESPPSSVLLIPDLPMSTEEILAPFMLQKISVDSVDLKKAGDPLLLCKAVFQAFCDFSPRRNDSLLAARRILDHLLLSYQPAIRTNQDLLCLYGYEHFSPESNLVFKRGWHSAMDSSLLTLDLLIGSQIFRDKRYYEGAFRAFHSFSNNVERGGCTWRAGGPSSGRDWCWFSEYSQDNTAREKEFYVLNGHLFALQVVRHISDLAGWKNAQKLYEDGARGFRIHANDFWNRRGTWPMYMLNPLIANPVGYVQYEIRQLKALFLLTGDAIYDEEARKRLLALQRYYPIWILKGADRYSYLFSSLGVPYPYQNGFSDYRCKIAIFDQNGVEMAVQQPLLPTSSWGRGFSLVETKDRGVIAELRIPTDFRTLSYLNWPMLEVNQKHSLPRWTVSTSLDAIELKSLRVTVSPAHRESADEIYWNDEARISFDVKIDTSQTMLFGPILKSEVAIKSLMISLSDIEGGIVSTYYPGIQANAESLILISPIGFNSEKCFSDHLNKVTVHILTTGMGHPRDPFFVDIIDFVTVRNGFDLYAYFKNNPIVRIGGL